MGGLNPRDYAEIALSLRQLNRAPQWVKVLWIEQELKMRGLWRDELHELVNPFLVNSIPTLRAEDQQNAQRPDKRGSRPGAPSRYETPKVAHGSQSASWDTPVTQRTPQLETGTAGSHLNDSAPSPPTADGASEQAGLQWLLEPHESPPAENVDEAQSLQDAAEEERSTEPDLHDVAAAIHMLVVSTRWQDEQQDTDEKWAEWAEQGGAEAEPPGSASEVKQMYDVEDVAAAFQELASSTVQQSALGNTDDDWIQWAERQAFAKGVRAPEPSESSPNHSESGKDRGANLSDTSLKKGCGSHGRTRTKARNKTKTPLSRAGNSSKTNDRQGREATRDSSAARLPQAASEQHPVEPITRSAGDRPKTGALLKVQGKPRRSSSASLPAKPSSATAKKVEHRRPAQAESKAPAKRHSPTPNKKTSPAIPLSAAEQTPADQARATRGPAKHKAEIVTLVVHQPAATRPANKRNQPGRPVGSDNIGPAKSSDASPSRMAGPRGSSPDTSGLQSGNAIQVPDGVDPVRYLLDKVVEFSAAGDWESSQAALDQARDLVSESQFKRLWNRTIESLDQIHRRLDRAA